MNDKKVTQTSNDEQFPVLGEPRSIPWGLIAPHEAQALRNHGQSLNELARRGGLSWYEMLCALQDQRALPIRMTDEEARPFVEAMVRDYNA